MTWLGIPPHAQAAAEKPPASPSAGPTAQDPGPFVEHLRLARKQLSERGPELESDIRTVGERLRNLEVQLRDRKAPELIADYEELVRQRETLEAELKQAQDLASAYQDATDSYLRSIDVRKELDEFRGALAKGAIKFRTGDTGIFEAYLRQQRSVQNSQKEQMSGRRQRLEEINNQLKRPDARGRSVLELERNVLQIHIDTEPVRRGLMEARLALYQVRLDAARELGEVTVARPTTQTQPATSTAAADIEAENKRKLALELELEARDRLAYVRQQVADYQQQLAEAAPRGEDTASLENNIQYWREAEEYERRRIRQATFKKQEAQLKQQITELDERVQYALASLESTQASLSNFTREERRKLAFRYRTNAEDLTGQATQLDRDARRMLSWVGTVQETLPLLDAAQNAMDLQLKGDLPLADYQRLYAHFLQMKRIWDTERQQIDQMVTTQTVTYYQNLRLATLKRRLADAYLQTAEVLVPTQPSFFERNRKIFRALGILLAMVLAGYLVKTGVWLIGILATYLRNAMPSSTFSIKRITTLASFAASIARLFIWVFGIIAILSEFGIDPAKSSGAIGLVGLIMAGMFQQLVVDFIKGLDIAGGRHYNVGDFVEVDSKFGHVIDFSVKYTRIRTLSGQELNIPNSRCIPSRRFPEGYVDNYVDIVLASGAEVSEAKAAIQPVCLYLNRRLEPLKERPQFIDRFRAVGGRAILRYRVRVLPGCDWVVTDYFIPSVKNALAARDIALDGEPKYFFINRIETFRKLFSRQLTEQEILHEAAEAEAHVAERNEKSAPGSNGHGAHDKPLPPPEAEIHADGKESEPSEPRS